VPEDDDRYAFTMTRIFAPGRVINLGTDLKQRENSGLCLLTR